MTARLVPCTTPQGRGAAEKAGLTQGEKEENPELGGKEMGSRLKMGDVIL